MLRGRRMNILPTTAVGSPPAASWWTVRQASVTTTTTAIGTSTSTGKLTFLSLSPRYWTGPFAGRLKSNENL